MELKSGHALVSISNFFEIKTLPGFKMAERVGFEPTKDYSPLLVFKTSAFNHSATSPSGAREYMIIRCGKSIRYN
jgi:hypothetical protein